MKSLPPNVKRVNAAFKVMICALDKFRRTARDAGSPIKSLSFSDLGHGETRTRVRYQKV